MIVGIRHGHVHNPDGVVYARLPGFGLSEAGRAEAAALAGALAGAPVRAVHASPLERAVETAEILARPHGLEVRTDERLLEWAFWVRWQGMPWAEIRQRHADLLDEYAADPGAASPEDPLERVGRRVLAWADEAEAAHPGELVLGVTHEAPLSAALLLGSGRGLEEFHARNLPHLATVRLLPGPAEVLDLAEWARSC